MLRTFASTLLLLCSFILQAQKPPIKFGDVPIDQLKMTTYDKDSSASAVILADYGESVIEYSEQEGFVVKFERLTRIKILTKEGLDQANFSIPLYHSGGSDEKLAGLKAITYNLEKGKVVESKLKTDAIFREKYDANLDFMKVTLPNVKEGSVIEITYRITSDFVINFQDWEFQSTIPTVWSEYRARIPEYYNYEKYMQGYVALSVNEQTREPNSIKITSRERSGGESLRDGAVKTTFSNDQIDFQEDRFRWAARDVPAFKPEPFITTSQDYISKLNFELSFTQFPNQPRKSYLGSWEDINKLYAESSDFGGEVTGNAFLKKTEEEITEGLTTPEEKIGAICNYVRQTIVWDGTNRKFIKTTLRKVTEEKKGNSADINLLLASLLDKADFSVSPVLLSTRDHGFVRELTPASSQFNYVVCLVRLGDKKLLLDATDKLLATGTLPERCLNGNGLVVSKAGYEWIKLQSPGKSKLIVNTDLAIVNVGELTGKIQIDRTGYYAQNVRKKYFSEGESDYIKNFKGSRSWEFSKSEFQNANDITLPFKESHEVSISDHITAAGDMIYLNPFVLDREQENPFKLEKREYPVDFGSPFDKMFLVKITLPEGYGIDELPKSKVLSLTNNAARYFYNVVQKGNTINITSSLAINQSLFSQEEYPNLREFYNQIVAKQAEQIVLKKK
ncbi:MAG: hypothetical protein AABY93_05285 [Bacteroidota bacterium]